MKRTSSSVLVFFWSSRVGGWMDYLPSPGECRGKELLRKLRARIRTASPSSPSSFSPSSPPSLFPPSSPSSSVSPSPAPPPSLPPTCHGRGGEFGSGSSVRGVRTRGVPTKCSLGHSRSPTDHQVRPTGHQVCQVCPPPLL